MVGGRGQQLTGGPGDGQAAFVERNAEANQDVVADRGGIHVKRGIACSHRDDETRVHGDISTRLASVVERSCGVQHCEASACSNQRRHRVDVGDRHAGDFQRCAGQMGQRVGHASGVHLAIGQRDRAGVVRGETAQRGSQCHQIRTGICQIGLDGRRRVADLDLRGVRGQPRQRVQIGDLGAGDDQAAAQVRQGGLRAIVHVDRLHLGDGQRNGTVGRMHVMQQQSVRYQRPGTGQIAFNAGGGIAYVDLQRGSGYAGNGRQRAKIDTTDLQRAGRVRQYRRDIAARQGLRHGQFDRVAVGDGEGLDLGEIRTQVGQSAGQLCRDVGRRVQDGNVIGCMRPQHHVCEVADRHTCDSQVHTWQQPQYGLRTVIHPGHCHLVGGQRHAAGGGDAGNGGQIVEQVVIADGDIGLDIADGVGHVHVVKLGPQSGDNRDIVNRQSGGRDAVVRQLRQHGQNAAILQSGRRNTHRPGLVENDRGDRNAAVHQVRAAWIAQVILDIRWRIGDHHTVRRDRQPTDRREIGNSHLGDFDGVDV